MPTDTPPVPCSKCRLRCLPHMRDFDRKQLDFISRFKIGDIRLAGGSELLVQTQISPHLFTVYEGWAARVDMLEDGRRQILNFALPGDFLGLQSELMDGMRHSVEAITDIQLCVFERARLWEMFEHHPSLAFDITWLAAHEERLVDNSLLSVGKQTAIERIAYLLLDLFGRLEQLEMASTRNRCRLPLTQQDIADATGLSLVHTNKTLKALARQSLIRIAKGTLEILDRKQLQELAAIDTTPPRRRPFI